MQGGRVCFPIIILVFLSLAFLTHNGVRAEKAVEEEGKEMKKVSLSHMRGVQDKDAVTDDLPMGQKEYDVLDQMIKSMMDIKALIEKDTQLNYETIQILPTMDVSVFLELLRRATAAKFELLARILDDITGGVSRSALAVLDDAQTSFQRKTTTTSTTTTITTTTTTTPP